ncbi:diaminobutyrate acetyltransferase [Brevibacillus panacihumi]|uniref:diaminobutyrate acetyltransferase n=1 Tax=Brevibacillus panacihumi TaxID=497735 RepID=UPI003D1F18B8
MKTSEKLRSGQISLRSPTEDDGASMWRLARDSGVLEMNSAYAYLMFARFFQDTCVVAEIGEEIVGFVTGFYRPDQEDTLFIWQIGVHDAYRGMGIAKSMIQELLRRGESQSIRYLEATVSPANEASSALFKGVGKTYKTHCRIEECFPAHLFPGGAHEAEWTYRIGPIPAHD